MNPFKKIESKYIASRLALCGRDVYIEKPIIIQCKYVEMGDGSHILKGARIQNVSGDEDIRIRIGKRTGIGYRISVLAGADVNIGDDVAIASDVFLSAGNHGINPECEISYGCQSYKGNAINIGDGAWIGEKVCVMSGISIGKGSIIGAGGVVVKDIPDYSIAVGNPAKVVKKYNFRNHCWERV